MKIKDIDFVTTEQGGSCDRDFLHIGQAGELKITVLDRLTGFGFRDTETGFRDSNNKFWLASGNFDIRNFPDLELWEAIEKIKENANVCTGA